jgi:hypothetical protein
VGSHNRLFYYSRFPFSRHSRCIRCGSDAIQRLKKRDKQDGFLQNPLALIQGLTGAPVNRCSSCRLQFFDWRRPRPGDIADS